MGVVSLLFQSQSVGAISAPLFAWLAAIVLPGVALYYGAKLGRAVYGSRRLYRDLLRQLEQIRKQHDLELGKGLRGRVLDDLSAAFEAIPQLASSWRAYQAQLVRRTDAEGEDRYWTATSSGEAFSDAGLVDARMNRSFYVALPGIITAAGLLCTFLAILVALMEVRVTNDRVEGLDTLIEGLSGKFVSSIAALLAATFFIPWEKRLLHGLTESRQQLVAQIDALIPRLSAVHVLSDLEQHMEDQSVSFRQFNADLAGRLKQSFSESLKPTLELMVGKLGELGELLGRAEAQKQESITGSVEQLLRNLERSMTTSIEAMGARFTDALSGSTLKQLDKVAESLNGTGRLIEGMNSQFQQTQVGLNDLITFAKQSTSEQLSLGRTQVTELTEVLRNLMMQLNDTANSSAQRVSDTLNGLVGHLSQQVSDLSRQMSEVVGESAAKAAGAASSAIQRADELSVQSVSRLTELLERHRSDLDRSDALRSALDTTFERFQKALGTYAGATDGVQRAQAQLTALLTSATAATQSMKTAQEAVQQVTAYMVDQVKQLSDANRSQAEVWTNIQQRMQEYHRIFSQVNQAGGALLTEITKHVNNHVEITKSNFTELAKVGNEHVANATQRLGQTINELSEYLEDLTEVLGKAPVRR